MKTAQFCALAGIMACRSATAFAEPTPGGAVPFPSWTGPYFGAHGGFTNTKGVLESDVFNPPALMERMKGPAFGVQTGYNHQWEFFVLGVEADISYVGLRREFTEFNDFRTLPAGSVRPRLGVDLNGYLMPYVTSGVSYLRLTQDGSSTTSAAFGYAWGGGVAVRFNNHWSVFAEYLRSEPLFYEHRFPEFRIVKAHFESDLIRAGVNYHARWGHPSVGNQARGPFDWSGFYVGLNGGYLAGEQVNDFYPVDRYIDLRGPAVGAQAGYSQQIGQTVLGIETDFSYLAARGEDDFVKARMDKLGQLRARVGYDINGIQPYVSGGIAYGTGTLRVTSSFESASFGYVLGGGAAVRVNGQWSGYLEAMHVLLEDNPTDNSASTTLIRAGLNYHAR